MNDKSKSQKLKSKNQILKNHPLFMSNKYGIPEKELKQIRARDKTCVYCHKKMTNSKNGGWRGDWATIEHLNHLPPWNNPKTVVICCGSCNSSRGNKTLLDWFQTKYCLDRNRNININTVAKVVKDYINQQK